MASIAMSRAEQEEERQHALRVQRSLRDNIQARADDAFEPWGFRAPAPVLGCDPDEYRRDMLIKAKKLLPGTNELRHVQIRQLPRSVLSKFEDMIYPAARAEAWRPDSVPRGEMRKVYKPQPGGHEIIEWIGQESFVKDPRVGARPGRRVTGFLFPDGHYRLPPHRCPIPAPCRVVWQTSRDDGRACSGFHLCPEHCRSGLHT